MSDNFENNKVVSANLSKNNSYSNNQVITDSTEVFNNPENKNIDYGVGSEVIIAKKYQADLYQILFVKNITNKNKKIEAIIYTPKGTKRQYYNNNFNYKVVTVSGLDMSGDLRDLDNNFMSKDRLITRIDAVMAIIMTILVLDLK